MMNTSYLYKPIFILSIYLFGLHFISVGAFPPFILIMIAWVFVLRSYNDDGRLVKTSFIIIIIDFLIYMLQIGSARISGIIWIVYVPLGLMFVLMVLSLIAVNREFMYFNRTIQSMNPEDRELAIKAMKTKDPNDFAKVAEYTSWNSVS